PEFQSKDSLLVYPNPVQDSFMLNRSVRIVKVFSIDGKLIKSFQGDFDINHCFDVSFLETGLYFITLGGDNNNLTYKFVKH
ncbi:MAG: T9SS type A sorting domain-containing protein, partial [Flavobacteriaceae bacterium]|nr:T9SS type A sorting domain-containing protein [Flavobacteriaceae bacterium]